MRTNAKFIQNRCSTWPNPSFNHGRCANVVPISPHSGRDAEKSTMLDRSRARSWWRTRSNSSYGYQCPTDLRIAVRQVRKNNGVYWDRSQPRSLPYPPHMLRMQQCSMNSKWAEQARWGGPMRRVTQSQSKEAPKV